MRHFLHILSTRSPWLLALLGLVGLPMLVFAKTAQEVWEEQGFSFDTPTLLFIHRFATPGRDHLAELITTLAGPTVLPFIVLLLTALFWFSRRHRDAVFVFLTVAGATLLMLTVKVLFHRVRPHLWVSPAPETDYGFPSGHSIASFSLGLALILIAWPTRWRVPVTVLAVLVILAVAFSRLYLGVHYPSDVLGAWGAGGAWTGGLYRVLFRPRPRAG